MNVESIYTAKANDIIKAAIKSAVYIDEKAWNPFFDELFNDSIEEHLISKELFKNFKDEGINLCIHKYSSDELNTQLKRYLFEGVDIVLLDWDLDTDKLNTPALKLLTEVIEQPHIHFCCIYSSSPHFDDIIKKLCSYFSGINESQYQQIRELIEPHDSIPQLLKDVDITKDANSSLIGKINQIDTKILKDAKSILNKDHKEIIKDLYIAINDNLPKAEKTINYYKEIISNIDSEFTLLIKNTIVTIQKKKNNKPDSFIKKFSQHISKDMAKSYFKILGLDMQNEFSRKSAFINPDILNINLNTFLYHRRTIVENGDHVQFEQHIKEVMMKNAELNFNDSKLSFLDQSFLNSIDENNLVSVSEEQKALINTFYNGAVIHKEDALLNFGDIFICNGTYYLCITALCDCLIHLNDGKEESNIDYKYYFVRGSKLPGLSDGFLKGDGGFVSYIDEKTCVSWTQGEYIKPFQLYIPKPQIKNGKITAHDWGREPQGFELEYKFTLKQNYAQRIANHAFTHPVRVGVDFVKK